MRACVRINIGTSLQKKKILNLIVKTSKNAIRTENTSKGQLYIFNNDNIFAYYTNKHTHARTHAQI